MPKYKIVYEYVTRGYMEMEAKNKKDAQVSYWFQNLGENDEEVVKNRVVSIEEIK